MGHKQGSLQQLGTRTGTAPILRSLKCISKQREISPKWSCLGASNVETLIQLAIEIYSRLLLLLKTKTIYFDLSYHHFFSPSTCGGNAHVEKVK